MSSFMLVFCCEFTSVLNRRRIFPSRRSHWESLPPPLVMTRGSKETLLLLTSVTPSIISSSRSSSSISGYSAMPSSGTGTVTSCHCWLPSSWSSPRGPRRGLPRQGRPPPTPGSPPTATSPSSSRSSRPFAQGAGRPLPQVDPANRRPRRRSGADESLNGNYPAEGLLFTASSDAVPRAPREGKHSAVDIRLGDSSLRYLSILFGHAQLRRPLGGHASGGEFRVPQQLPVPRMEGAIQRNGGFVGTSTRSGMVLGPVRLERRPRSDGDDS